MLETNEAKLECAVATCAESTLTLACFALISSCNSLFWHCRWALDIPNLRLTTLNQKNFGITERFLHVEWKSKSSFVLPSLRSIRWNFPNFWNASFLQAGNEFLILVTNCHFIFNGQIYQQIDGVAMGSPLGSLFDNIFMSLKERSWLHSCPSSFKPFFVSTIR